MSKTDYFELPYTVSEILNGKNVKEATAGNDLASLVDSLAENEAALIQGNLIPQRYSNAKKFFRYGQELYLRTPHSKLDAIKKRLRPCTLLFDAFSRIPNQPIAAVSFYSLYDFSTVHRFMLEDVIQGVKLYGYSVRYAAIDIAEDREYKQIKEKGSNIVVKVPSRSEKRQRREFTMQHIPIYDNQNKYLLWSVVEGNCYCEDKRFETSLKSKTPGKNPINYCPHEIAAYIAIAARQRRKNNEVTAEVMPFPKISPRMAKFWKNLTTRVMIEDNRKRPLNKAERNILLADFVKKFGPREAMRTRQVHYADYKW